jgi:uncharacterized protein YdeI (YjbR/CyaY-like superfamily)
MNPKVDFYFSEVQKFDQELNILRQIVLDCGLIEELKWGVPCYTFQNNNIVLIHAFKDYCALLFMKGALLNDSEGILIQQTENVQSGRQIRFTNLKEISDLKTTIKAYIFEAIEVEKAGLKVVFKSLDDFTIPEEFQIRLDNNLDLKNAFEALTPGRQKGYIFHFSEAKQPKTRVARIDKFIPKILMGKGFNDCTCGLSKRMPSCDGSHKKLNDSN